MLTKPLGGPLNPNTDHHDWKKLLDDAGVRAGRLHDARHTAATVLTLLGIPDRVIDQIRGWAAGTSSRVRARYLHVPDAVLKDVAQKLADAIGGPHRAPLWTRTRTTKVEATSKAPAAS
ncbi:tyrosine-type recombinase/integrase, partial [Streptomyces fimicarius]